MLTIKFQRNYKKTSSKTGLPITMFVYGVNGNDKDLEAYKEAQGEHYREDESGKPVWFSSKYVGESGKLLITSNGKVVPDTSEYDKAASIVNQYGGNLGQALANAFAGKLIGQPVSAAPVAVTNPVDDDPKLD